MDHTGRRASGESGASLVEALVVLFLASVVILVFAFALETVIRTDGLTSRQQRNNLVLTSVTEALRRNDLSYYVCCPGDPTPCDFGSGTTLEARYKERVIDKLSTAGNAVPDFDITEVAYWKPGSYPAAPATTVGGSFSAGLASCDRNTSALRFKVAVRVGGDQLTGEVVKRRPLPGESTGGA